MISHFPFVCAAEQTKRRTASTATREKDDTTVSPFDWWDLWKRTAVMDQRWRQEKMKGFIFLLDLHVWGRGQPGRPVCGVSTSRKRRGRRRPGLWWEPGSTAECWRAGASGKMGWRWLWRRERIVENYGRSQEKEKKENVWLAWHCATSSLTLLTAYCHCAQGSSRASHAHTHTQAAGLANPSRDIT